MQEIVIIGSGPIGLVIAIILKNIVEQAGLSTNITVIDPNVGEFTRPGVVARNSLDLLDTLIREKIDVPYSGTMSQNAMYIKDLQTRLYKIAESKKITFIKAEFKQFINNGVLADEEKISCDLVIDCSGERRIAVRKLNKKNSNNPPFQISRVGDNPIKDHFVAFITMDPHNAKLSAKKDKPDPVNYTLALENLRVRFGWSEHRSPTFDSGEWKEKERKIRFYNYFEMPPNLAMTTTTKQKEWLTAVLALRSGHKNIKFEIEHGPLKFLHFKVDPHKVSPSCYIGDKDTPMVIPCGDAQISPDYRIGRGILSGLRRADALYKSIEIIGGKITINIQKYEALIQRALGEHEAQLKGHYNHMRKAHDTYDLVKAGKLYQEALNQCEKGSDEERIIQNGLSDIRCKQAKKLYSDCRIVYSKITDKDGNIPTNICNNIPDQALLNKYENNLIKACLLNPESRAEARNEMLVSLQKLAACYKDLAGKLFKRKSTMPNAKFEYTIKFYEKSLEIYETYFETSQKDEIVKIKSNLIVIANKLGKYEDVIKMADDKALNDERRDPRILAKVKYNKCIAIINKAFLEAETTDIDTLQNDYNTANNLFIELNKQEKHVGEKALETMQKKLGALNDKINSLTPGQQPK